MSRTYSFIGFLIIWQLIAMIVADQVLPSPSNVLVSMWESMRSGELLSHMGITLRRVGLSFLIAMSIGVGMGMLMGSRTFWDKSLDSVLMLALNVPALVTIILCYVWMGLTELAAVMAVAINKIPMVVVAVREGARAVNPDYLVLGKIYKLPRKTVFMKLYLPQLLPYLFGAARNGLALIWKIVLVVELLGRSNGVGFQLGVFFQFFDITSILAYTFAFVAVVFAIETFVFRPLELRLNRWRQ